MTGDRDIMTSMLVQMSTQILSFLDARSLLSCSLVNEGWNEITNNVSPEIWFQACVDDDIFVNSDKYTKAEDWKKFLFSMMQRKNDMQTSACFEITRATLRTFVTAIYYHNGKIALAYPDKIEVWNVSEHRFYRGFHCRFETTFLKFDDNILLSGSKDGLVRLWSIPSGRFFRNYSDIEEIPTCFDFLSDYDIVVNGFFKKKCSLTGVRVCILSDQLTTRKLIFQPQSLIVRVMLSPHRDYPLTEQQKTCYLFCLASDYISVSVLTLQYPDIFYVFLSLQKQVSPFELRILSDRPYKPPGGLLFDGRKLYVMIPSHTPRNTGIFQWDLETNDVSYSEDNGIVSFLGVGDMYLAYETKSVEGAQRIRIAHKNTHEILATINLPWRRVRTDDYLCLCETSWLDGLNGENDSGLVGAYIADFGFSLKYINFLPRRHTQR